MKPFDKIVRIQANDVAEYSIEIKYKDDKQVYHITCKMKTNKEIHVFDLVYYPMVNLFLRGVANGYNLYIVYHNCSNDELFTNYNDIEEYLKAETPS